MTYKTCLKLAEFCRSKNDEAGAKLYESRAEKKMKKLGLVQEKKEAPKEEVKKEVVKKNG